MVAELAQFVEVDQFPLGAQKPLRRWVETHECYGGLADQDFTIVYGGALKGSPEREPRSSAHKEHAQYLFHDLSFPCNYTLFNG